MLRVDIAFSEIGIVADRRSQSRDETRFAQETRSAFGTLFSVVTEAVKTAKNPWANTYLTCSMYPRLPISHRVCIVCNLVS